MSMSIRQAQHRLEGLVGSLEAEAVEAEKRARLANAALTELLGLIKQGYSLAEIRQRHRDGDDDFEGLLACLREAGVR